MERTAETLITTSIGNFCQVTGIGRSKTYELLAAGALDSLKIGKRRLIILDSYRKLIEQQRSAGSLIETGTPHGAAPAPPGDAPAAPRRGRGRPRKADLGQRNPAIGDVGVINGARDD
jgi:excisionase family DNA binding protein